MRKLGAAAAVALLSLTLAFPAVAGNVPGQSWPMPPGRSSRDVTDYGRTVDRNHYTAEEPNYPMCLLWNVPLGMSRSQPVVVRADYDGDGSPETRIFHLAGGYLWALDGDTAPVVDRSLPAHEQLRQLETQKWVKWKVDAQEGYSASHIAYWRGPSPAEDVVYAGTGQPSLLAVNAATGKDPRNLLLPASETELDCLGNKVRDFRPDYGLVTAPLVFPDGTAVVGTTDGEVLIIRNLTGDGNGGPSVNKKCLGGRISSSPVPIGTNAFIIAADARQDASHGAGEYGYVTAFYIWDKQHNDFDPRWPQPNRHFFTPSGVPGEVAVDGTLIFFADKSGTLYALTLEDGRLIWSEQLPGYPDESVGAFINMGPGLGTEHAYFSVRSGDGSGRGSVVAVRKRTGQAEWQAALPGDGNTAPVPLPVNPMAGADPMEPGAVLVGDTAGQVTAWRQGQPAHFAVPAACGDLTAAQRDGRPLPTIAANLVLTDQPYRARHFWDPINGTGTQMTVAYDLMLVGVNSADPNQTALRAYRLLPAVNLKVTGRPLRPGPYEVGKPVDVEVTVAAHANQDVRDAPVAIGWVVDGAARGAETRTLNFPQGRSEQVLQMKLNLPAQAAELWVAVNPEALVRDPRGQALPPGLWAGGSYSDPALAYEVTLSDNIWRMDALGRPVDPGQPDPNPPGPNPPGPNPPGPNPPGPNPPGPNPPGPNPPGGGERPPCCGSGGGPPTGVDVGLDYITAPVQADSNGYEIRVGLRNTSPGALAPMLEITAGSSTLYRAPVSLNPGEVREIKVWSGNWPPGLQVRSRAVLDPNNELAEEDETNNIRETLTQIKAPEPPPPDTPPNWGSHLVG